MILMMAMFAFTVAALFKTTYLPVPGSPGQRLALHCIAPERPTHKSVLFIHGASFPTRLAAGYEFSPGDSWMGFMARQGFLACGLDFLGFGESSRPPAMLGAADAAAPVTRAAEAADEIALAVDYLQKQPGMKTIHLVAHSWGTIPATAFAASHPGALKSLTLFGPIVPGRPDDDAGSEHPAWFALTAQERLEQLRFKKVLPAGKQLLDPAVEKRWAAQFEASVPHVTGDKPGVLRIPEGPNVDISAVGTGAYPYDPKALKLPLFVVYGNYDVVVNDSGAKAFLARFSASPLKWQLRLDDGTHVMHLEKIRRSLYASVNAFISATELAP